MYWPHSTHAHSNGMYRPHCGGTVKSSLFTHVHSHWLPGYTDVMQTVLVILIVAGLFLDRPQYVAIETLDMDKMRKFSLSNNDE